MSAPEQPTRSMVDARSHAAPGIPAPPVVTGRYTLGTEIDRGGMGIVYRATDTVLGRDVAVKVLHEKYGPGSGAAVRFADEARITGQLQHPSIPPVHDVVRWASDVIASPHVTQNCARHPIVEIGRILRGQIVPPIRSLPMGPVLFCQRPQAAS